jgi:GntR family transcriptional repressor for pyruvate dehydrogenase complex
VVAEVGNTLNRALELLLALEQVNLRELFEVRRILEGEAAALAVERHTADDLARLDEAIGQMDGGLRDADEEGYVAADVSFHLAVAEATGNRIAVQMMLAIRDVLRQALVSVFHIPGSPERSNDDHRAIREAIAAGSPDEARRLMIDHLARVEDDIRDVALRSSFAPVLPGADETASRP